MGNQTLVPSQIQSVDSYLLELKSYMQFRQSLGSTTFMKTARVTLVEGDETTNSTTDTGGGVIDSAVATVGGVGGGGGVTASGVGGGGSVSAVSNPGSGVMGTGSDDSSLTGATPKLLLSQPQLVRQRLQRMREEQQPVVVKIFPRYDPSIRLDVYSKRVREIKNIIYSRYGPSTNCLPFYELIITDKAAFLLRQYVKYSLYDRMSTRPFLTPIEKRWLAFQLLCAVHEIHSLQIVHGDMKTENVLVNSFLWVSLADLASYKPVYLSKNHPSADFNYYFDISRRRTCCLAPERLEPTLGSQSGGGSGATGGAGVVGDMLMGEDMLMPPDPNDFAPSMDIFSLGCVLAELFMERPLFDFAQLLAYRDHKYDPSGELRQEIGDPDVLEMIFSMISLKPSERKSANEYLQEQSERAFPSYFVFLKNYISRFISARLSADEIVVKLKADLSILMRTLKQHDTDESSSATYQQSSENQQSPSAATSNASVLSTSSHNNKPPNNDAFLILLSLLLSCVRKIKLAENKFIAIDLMSQFSKFLDDSVVLDRVLPYYLCLLDDSSAPRECLKTSMVKSHVIYALNDCLTNVCNIDVRNMNIFPELIFDCLERASKDESYLVRAAVAKTISSFAITSLRYLEAAHAVRSSLIAANFGASSSTSSSSKQTTTQTTNVTSNINNQQQQQQTTSELESNQTGNILLTPTGGGHRGHHVGGRQQQPTNVIKKIDHYSYEKEFESYQMRVTEIVMHLITDISQTTSNAANAVKEALIRSNIAKLCTFFSRQKTSEFLLPHMITMLNEKTDWSVRAAFFDALCPVLSCIGWESVEIVKPLLEQGLRDSEEFVIYRTLLSLAQMAGIGLLDKQQICYFLSVHVAPLLCHPSLWIRHGAVHFVCTLCRRSQNHYREVSDVAATDGASHRRVVTDNTPLTVADVLCSVAPTLAKFLSRSDLIAFDRAELLFGSLKRPIPRAVYDCIAQDARSNHLFIYLAQRSEIRCLNIFNNQNYLPGYIDCADPSVQELFDRLVRLGFLEEDEDKLLHMKDFMEKTRVSRLSSSLHNQAATEMSMLAPSLRDGFISIMRDKFQRCNVELLGSKVSPFGADQLASAIGGGGQHHHHHHEAPSSSTASRKPEPINTEWSLMFGQNRVVPESNTTTTQTATTTSQATTGEEQQPSAARLKSRGSIRGSPSETPTPGRIASSSAVTRKLHDCIFDVDRYLDRCKIMYEDQRNKYLRCAARAKETINATSLSSNQVCLSGGKWRPRGHLVFHSNEHTKSIDRLSRNADATYFATLSGADGCVKIWSTESLLTAKSGFYKSVFTYDRQNHGGGGASTSSSGGEQQQGNSFRPSCISFFNRHSLAILCEDYRFYVIDFNSDRTQYRLSSFERLFRANACKSIVSHSGQVTSPSGVTSPGFNRTSFFYLNRALRPTASNTTTAAAHARCSTRSCACPSNYPIEMIRIDDTSPSWPAAATSYYEYFRASPVRGLFVYSTSTGDVSCVDMRSRSRAFELRRDLSRGYVTSMITDPWYTWLALGSSYGTIELYDFRFMLPVQTFEHRLRTSVVRMCTHPGSTPTSSSDRIVASYQGNNEICVWPTSSVGSNQSGEPIREPDMVFWGVQSVPPLCSNKISNSYISGLVSVASSSASDDTCGLVCASSDMKLRYVDLAEPARDSYVVSSAFNFQHNTKVSNDIAPNKPAEFAASVLSHSSITYEMKRIEGTNVLVELDSAATTSGHPSGQSSGAQVVPAQHSNANSPALIHQSYFTHHQDAITDLVVCYNPAANRNQPLIVTSARDGTLKIWR